MAPQTKRTSPPALRSPVKWRLLDQAIYEAREAFADVPGKELNNIVREAIASVRKEKHGQRKRRREK